MESRGYWNNQTKGTIKYENKVDGGKVGLN